MIKSINQMDRDGIHIDLTGPMGNAVHLLALAKSLSEQLGHNWPNVERRMKSSDYENLLKVFDAEFGEIVTLYR
jgi:hypothetical protein